MRLLKQMQMQSFVDKDTDKSMERSQSMGYSTSGTRQPEPVVVLEIELEPGLELVLGVIPRSESCLNMHLFYWLGNCRLKSMSYVSSGKYVAGRELQKARPSENVSVIEVGATVSALEGFDKRFPWQECCCCCCWCDLACLRMRTSV